MERNYPVEEESSVELRRQQFLRSRCERGQNQGGENSTTSDGKKRNVSTSGFNPRAATEKLRNAVTVDRCVKELITTTVLNKLLTVADLIEIDGGRTWNKGGLYNELFCLSFIIYSCCVYYDQWPSISGVPSLKNMWSSEF